MLPAWVDVKHDVLKAAETGTLLPFVGSAISQFAPTNLPMGKGLLFSALESIFPNLDFSRDDLGAVEQVFNRYSPEVILQGLAEGLLDRTLLARIHNSMCGVKPNPVHQVLAAALVSKKIPAIFTTNQDRCIEEASGVCPVFDEPGFLAGLHQGLFQFHGAIGGVGTEVIRRRDSLAFTLHSMGPRLPESKHEVLKRAIQSNTLLFLGYSGCDPDVWFSLDEIFNELPDVQVFWCVYDDTDLDKHRQLARLIARHRGSIIAFDGNMANVLADLSLAWTIATPEHLTVDRDKCMAWCAELRNWACDLTELDRKLAYGWALVSIGQHQDAVEELEQLIRSTASPLIRPYHMMASLFGGYACRELSRHHDARRHLEVALSESISTERCRYAQAAGKIGESLSAFESFRFWYLWPTKTRIHAGARWLNNAITEYKQMGEEERKAKQIGRAGLGNSIMNLGQLYRRTVAYTKPFGIKRKQLGDLAKERISESIDKLRKEGDLRALPMAEAAIAADDASRSLQEKLKAINKAIEYAEEWNQDQIQIGSAYYIKGVVLSGVCVSDWQCLCSIESQYASHKSPFGAAEVCFEEAVNAFRKAGMKAESSRAQVDLAVVMCRLTRRKALHATLLLCRAYGQMLVTQGSWEWRIIEGVRALGRLILSMIRGPIASRH